MKSTLHVIALRYRWKFERPVCLIGRSNIMTRAPYQYSIVRGKCIKMVWTTVLISSIVSFHLHQSDHVVHMTGLCTCISPMHTISRIKHPAQSSQWLLTTVLTITKIIPTIVPGVKNGLSWRQRGPPQHRVLSHRHDLNADTPVRRPHRAATFGYWQPVLVALAVHSLPVSRD